MRLPRAPVLPLFLLAVAFTPARAADSEPIELTRDEDWRHGPSGFVFPQDVVTFTRVSAFRYDHEGRNVSVTYGDRALKILLTAYVYPNAGHPLAAHFQQVKRDVAEVHADARLLGEGVWNLDQGGRKFTGRRATFGFRVPINGKEQEVVSEAYLLGHGEHFIKFRVTCPKEKFEVAADRASRFLRSLKLPQPVAAGAEK